LGDGRRYKGNRRVLLDKQKILRAQMFIASGVGRIDGGGLDHKTDLGGAQLLGVSDNFAPKSMEGAEWLGEQRVGFKLKLALRRRNHIGLRGATRPRREQESPAEDPTNDGACTLTMSHGVHTSPFQDHLGNGAGGAVGERQMDMLNALRDTALVEIAV